MNKTETTTNYYVSKNSESNGSWIEGIDHIRVNVDDFIKTDSELSSRLGKLQERKTQIIFDMDYHVVALGKLVCDDAEYIIQSGYWNCVFYPMSFSLLNNNDNNN